MNGSSSWHWTIPASRGTDEIELEPRRLRGGYRMYLNHVHLGSLPAPTDEVPWVERQMRLSDDRLVVIALEWNNDGDQAYLFADGMDVRDGTAINVRRSQAPSPVDPFDKLVRSFVASAPATAVGAGMVGTGLAAIEAVAISPLLIIPGAIAGFLLGYSLVAVYARIVSWLGSKHHWRLRTRRVLLSLVTVGPLIAIVVVASLLTH
jgi:hypothetical protein